MFKIFFYLQDVGGIRMANIITNDQKYMDILLSLTAKQDYTYSITSSHRRPLKIRNNKEIGPPGKERLIDIINTLGASIILFYYPKTKILLRVGKNFGKYYDYTVQTQLLTENRHKTWMEKLSFDRADLTIKFIDGK